MKKRKFISMLLCLALLLGNFSLAGNVVQAGNIENVIEIADTDREIVTAAEDEASNVLAGKNVTTSSVEAAMPGNTGDQVIDGNPDTRWSSERMKNSGITDADAQIPQWLVVDLKAESTSVTQLSIAFYLKVWATKYKIETADTNTESTSWEEVYSLERASSGETNLVDQITLEQPLKRYVRFYFEKINVNAGGTGVSVREITMWGTQQGLIVDTPIETDPNATYHRIFNSAQTEGMEVLYGSGVTIHGQENGLSLSYTNTRAGVVDKNMGKHANGVFETTIIPQDNGARFGMIMRANGNNQKLLVGTENSNSQWIWEFWNENAQQWSSTFAGPALAVGREAKIKVELLGNQVSLWVNDSQVFSQTLPTAAYMGEGYFGFDKCNSAGSYLVKEIKYTEKECAASVLYEIESLPALKIEDKSVLLPDVPEGYEIKVVGSDREGVITNDGKISDANIGNKEVILLVQVSNENQEDTARKSFTVRVPSKNSLREEIFEAVENPNKKPVIIPSIQEWYGYEGDFHINKDTKIIVNDVAAVELMEVAKEMQTDMKEITGLELAIETGNAKKNSIYIESLRDDSYGTGEEGYFMVTDKEGIKIYSHTYTGALYGTVTVEQILWRDDKHRAIPCGVVRDYPDYEIRGLMLDVGRIPHRIQYLKDYTKILKWYKMSEFHLHLNDDFNYNPQGLSTNWSEWTGMHRLESGVYPSLTEKRVYPENEYFNTEYADPIYTKEEYRGLEQLANSRGMDLIAEFDTPSHSTAYIEYAEENPDNISWLGPINTTTSSATNNRQMLALNVNHSNETERQHAKNARKFIEELYKDYLEGDNPTFTSDTVHVGADEYWDKSDPESFRDYTNFLADLMKSYGKTARMWGAQKVFPGTTYINPDNIVIDMWATYEEDPLARLAEGFRMVNVPQPYLYTTPGRDHKEMVGEEYLYKNWDPVIFNGNVRAEAGEPLLLGAKAALWGDEFREGITEADIHERMLRAIAITAEKTWGGQEAEDSYIDYQMAFEELQEGPGTEIAYEIKSKTEVVLDYDLSKAKEEKGNIIVKDGSGNQYHAEITGGTLVTVDEKTMVEFDGNTLMKTPLKTIGYPYTVSFDVKAKTGNADEAMLFSGYDGQLRAADVNGNITIKRSFFTQDSGYTIPTDKTVNITLVGTFQNTKMYVDGELVKMFHSTDSGVVGEYWSTFVFPLEEIGKNFKGYIGNIKVYNKSFPQDTFVNYETLEEVNVALNQEAYAERFGSQPELNTGNLKRHPAWKATDGDTQDANSYWLSSNHDSDYLMVDLEKTHQIHKVKVIWNGDQYARAFKIQVSEDGKNYRDAETVTGNGENENVIEFTEAIPARFVKVQGITRNANFYGIKELEVYEDVTLAREDVNVDVVREGLWITGIREEYEFSDMAIRPEIKVYDGEKLLVEKKDYTMVHKNNKNVYAKKEDDVGDQSSKVPQVIVKLKGNYSGTQTVYYKITPRDLKAGEKDAIVVVDTDKLSVTYKKEKQQLPLPTVYWNGKKLKYGKDFEIPQYQAAKKDKSLFVDAKSHEITIVGIGNYTGELKAAVVINDAKTVIPMSKVTVKGVKPQVWTTGGAKPTGYTVEYNKNALVSEGTEEQVEYKVSYRSNSSVGTGYLVLTGTGKGENKEGVVFVGTKSIPFKITGTSMKEVSVAGLLNQYLYEDGRFIVPTDEEDVETGKKKINLTDHGKELTEGTHYTVSYQKNVNKGTASVTFKGLESGGYTGVLKRTFKIIPKPVEEFAVTLDGAAKNENGTYVVPFVKGGVQPEIRVITKEGKELTKGTDYSVSYKDNKKVNQEATLTIKGKGNYTGNQSLKFFVKAKALSNENGIRVVAKDKIEGKAGSYKQSFKVYDVNNKSLNSGDYDTKNVTYTLVETPDENGNPVTVEQILEKNATVPAGSVIRITVKGINDYASTEEQEAIATGTYRILKKGYDIGKATIQLEKQEYTGQKIEITKMEQFVKGKVYLNTPDGKADLILDENIEVVENSYVKNLEKGTAKVTFKGKDGTDFGGTKTVSFKIVSRDTTSFWEIIFGFFGL